MAPVDFFFKVNNREAAGTRLGSSSFLVAPIGVKRAQARIGGTFAFFLIDIDVSCLGAVAAAVSADTMGGGDASPSRPRPATGEQQPGKQRSRRDTGRHSQDDLARQSHSIKRSTQLPSSLAQSTPLPNAKPPKSLRRVRDKKLRAHLSDVHLSQRRAAEHAKEVNDLLYAPAVGEESGQIETEDPLERTARVTQREIKDSIAVDAARKSFSLDLSGGKNNAGRGPYRCDYTRNGRHLLLGGRKGHLAALDWQTGKLMCEINVGETVRDVAWLHNNNFFAAAQKRYTYIYDNQGIEIHRLKSHTDVNRLQFLPYHFLLATVGQTGYLKYQDTSTGNVIAEHRTGLGPCATMAQNPLTAVIHLGHANGTVTLWTPNLTTPALKMLAHRGPVSGISISAKSGGREMATSGLDGSIKIWDARMLGRGPVREWISRRPANDISYSQRGLLGAAWGNHVSVYDTQKQMGNAPPGPYLTNGFPKGEPVSVNFCPFEDVLGVAHSSGFDSLIVPGAGEPRFDSSEADPYESTKSRREREVRALLDKVQPDTIALDPEMLGQINVEPDAAYAPDDAVAAAATKLPRASDGRPYARLTRIERLRLQGKADEGADAAVPDLRQEADESGDVADDGRDDDSDDDNVNGARIGAVEHRDWNAPTHIGKGPKTAKRKMRGRDGAAKRVAIKRSQNVDALNTEALRTRQQAGVGKRDEDDNGNDRAESGPTSALDYFATRSGHRKRPRGI